MTPNALTYDTHTYFVASIRDATETDGLIEALQSKEISPHLTLSFVGPVGEGDLQAELIFSIREPTQETPSEAVMSAKEAILARPEVNQVEIMVAKKRVKRSLDF